MKSLLRTILDECEKNKLMYRANPYDLYDNGCEDMIVPWGYDFKALVETMSEFELDERRGNIQLLPESEVKNHAELIKEIKDQLIQDYADGYVFSNQDDKQINSLSDDELIEQNPEKYYCGHYWIMWTNYGGNEHLDCFTDYTTDLDKYFDVMKLTNDWEDEYNKFRLGLI
tara:strand:- start:453 stop:965 length:513 start_codon:yes stop_codon:yes gene_type:complete